MSLLFVNALSVALCIGRLRKPQDQVSCFLRTIPACSLAASEDPWTAAPFKTITLNLSHGSRLREPLGPLATDTRRALCPIPLQSRQPHSAGSQGDSSPLPHLQLFHQQPHGLTQLQSAAGGVGDGDVVIGGEQADQANHKPPDGLG